MGLDQAFADRQAKTGAGDGAARTETLELVEDAGPVGRCDAGAVIDHAGDQRTWLGHDPDRDRRLGRGVFGSVLDQVGEHLIDHQVVDLDWRQLVGHLDLKRTTPQWRAQSGDHFPRELAKIVPVALGLERAAFDTRHIEQVADQAVEAIGLAGDGLEKAVLIGLAPGDLRLEQALGGGLDRSQRGAQVVRDGGEQRLAQLVGSTEDLGLLGLLAQTLTIDRGGELIGNGRQQAGLLGRERAPADQSQRADGSLSLVERHWEDRRAALAGLAANADPAAEVQATASGPAEDQPGRIDRVLANADEQLGPGAGVADQDRAAE
jgi:hypothetical protein